MNGAIRSDVEKKRKLRTAESIRLVDQIRSTWASVCEWRSKIGRRKKLCIAESIRLVDRIHSMWVSVCEWHSKIGHRNEKKITYSRIYSAGGSNTFNVGVSV